MKKEKRTEIATNVSSGAEKVEIVEKQVKQARQTDEKELGGNQAKAKGKAEKETAAAKARVEVALKKKEEKSKKAAAKAKAKKEKAAKRAKKLKQKAEARKALQEKRAAERKALQEKRRAERLALEEKRKEARNAKVRERAHQKANRAQAKSKRQAARKQERDSHRKEGRKDNGGWIAAVVTLGVTTLALTTALTVGAIDMKNTKDGIAAGYKCNTHELIGIMENVDNDLDRVRISNTPEQQGRILTDLLVQARLAELDLEKMPISAESNRNVTTFLNRVGATCERMLAKLRGGEALSAQDQETLARLYKTNHEIRAEIENLTEKMTDNDLMDFVNKGKGMIADVLDRLEKMTLGENGILENIKDKMSGAGNGRNGKNGESGEKDKGEQKWDKGQMPMPDDHGEAKIDPSKAEDLCMVYFADYKISEFQCVGETVSHGYGAYNVQGYDDNGTLLFAEIDYKTGDLLRFDYYEDCNEETFDYQNAERIAEEFLEKIGYDDMVSVRVRGNGTNADFTFVYEDDDVIFYPDTVKVKVCRTRGIVMGMDATKYLRNHKEREDVNVSITRKQAQESLHKDLEVESARLCVVQTVRGERAAYEFLCSYGEERYLIYTDAVDGREIAIVNLKNVG